jgi:hypothetical protein
LPTLPSQPAVTFKRLQPLLNALLAELDRLQPFLTVVVVPASGETFTVDGEPGTSGQPLPLDPGPHTVAVSGGGAKPRSFAVELRPSERRTLSIAAERDKLAAAEFATGTDHLLLACQDIERVARAPLAGAEALVRLAMCKRLFGLHAEADTLWNASDALHASKLAPPPDPATATALQTAEAALLKACGHFRASLELDPDLATELAVAGCELREAKLRPVRRRLERVLAPPSPLAAPRDELGRTQAVLARALLADLDRLQPTLRVDPAPGFRGKITVNGMEILPSTTIPIDPGHYIILQLPARGPRVVHDLIFHDRDRVVLKHNLRCNGAGKECVNPEASAPDAAATPAPRSPPS